MHEYGSIIDRELRNGAVEHKNLTVVQASERKDESCGQRRGGEEKEREVELKTNGWGW